MRDRLIFTGQFLFTLLVAAFLVVPAMLSISGRSINGNCPDDTVPSNMKAGSMTPALSSKFGMPR